MTIPRKILKTCLRRIQAGTTRRRRTKTNTTAIRRRRAQALARAHAAEAAACKRRRSSTCSSKVVSDKLEALKNLIPGHVNNGGGEGATVRAEELFRETADYILLLRTRVVVLQRLIYFYGSMHMDNQSVVIL